MPRGFLRCFLGGSYLSHPGPPNADNLSGTGKTHTGVPEGKVRSMRRAPPIPNSTLPPSAGCPPLHTSPPSLDHTFWMFRVTFRTLPGGSGITTSAVAPPRVVGDAWWNLQPCMAPGKGQRGWTLSLAFPWQRSNEPETLRQFLQQPGIQGD